MENLDEYKSRERAVTLTNGQWSDLTTWLLLNAKHAAEVAESWAKAGREKDEDGNVKYPNAVSNAEDWKELNASVDEIRKAIDRV